jgi:cell division septation protein DedD
VSGRPPLYLADEDLAVSAMSRELESLAAESTIRPPSGFTDQIMASIADQPLPQPARAFGAALLGGRLRAAVASIGDAWRVAFGGVGPIGVRAQALALVLVVAIGSLGLVGGAAVGAANVLTANPTTPPGTPLTSAPTPATITETPSPSPEPSQSPEGSPEASPSEGSGSPEPTPTSGGTERPHTPTPNPTRTDDHGGGDGGGDRTPEPTPTGIDEPSASIDG